VFFVFSVRVYCLLLPYLYCMKLKVFRSHEEMEIDRLKHIAEMDPIECLAYATDLILRAYGVSRQDLLQRTESGKITFAKTK